MSGYALWYNTSVMQGHTWWNQAGGYFVMGEQSRRHLRLLTLTWDAYLNWQARLFKELLCLLRLHYFLVSTITLVNNL